MESKLSMIVQIHNAIDAGLPLSGITSQGLLWERTTMRTISLLFITLLTGCGIDVDVKGVPEEVRVVHEIRIEALRPYIEGYCKHYFPNSDECVDFELDDFFNKYKGVKQ